ncbi:hypothetical protein BmR1_04g05280 [Babesia microti strain RI]|uniref:Uncharacterized protein n=1 Tax=Babesia microti (strain RI) TaxID=1133968 RepID=I7I9L6_BABMR|nr:hypothetical protein BmR1_04g05280 [Babesia microti strain RI]CCF75254.1 hypothetical protein BmR1_04g05280 [Babesia microti strain RI]|eukprot:XP_012649662.1 hypothetical protein BmR1_04g05280 [Babesia microti strain RI]
MDNEDLEEKNKRFCIIITSVLCVAFGLIILIGLGFYLKENYMIVSRYEYSSPNYNPPFRRDNFANYNGGNYAQEPKMEMSDYGC